MNPEHAAAARQAARDAGKQVGQWLEEYNAIRPHGSLNGRAPAQFIEDWVESESTLTRKQQTGNP